jgi:hypothetical protein
MIDTFETFKEEDKCTSLPFIVIGMAFTYVLILYFNPVLFIPYP